MTAPRQVLPGITYLVTRRCTQRQFLLRPSSTVNAIFLYVLAIAATRFGIEVHAFCVLSNHVHLLVTDPDARLPEFEQYLDSLVARAVNASLGRWGSFWEGASSYSGVTLVSPRDVLDKAAYVLANPVAAGLVRKGNEWPGLWSGVERIGGPPITAKRPDRFFSKKMPATVDLQLTCPSGFDTAEAFQAQLAAALEEREHQAASELAQQGRRFLGRYAVLQQCPDARPRSGEPRRGLSPRVACRDKWKRMETLMQLLGFLRSYRTAWKAFRNGVRDVIFPAGTYGMRVNLRVQCAAPG
jgi:putative transposase